jgi:CelD/BcsL family acetyltransferase involved in cellulose biosynthesis
MFEFYLRQAVEIAQAGELELVFLRHQGRAIAFEYGWVIDGIYFSPKVGYDETYARLSPGQLLRYLHLEQSFSRRDSRAIDFLGPLSEATAKWSTNSYSVGSVVASSGTLPSRFLLWTYRRAVDVRAWLQTSGFAGHHAPSVPLSAVAR